MIRLAVRCRAELGDRVLAELLELAPGGVEEDHGDEWVEYAIYGPPGELPAVPALEAAAGDGLVEISSTEIPDDWADRWRDFHHPVSIAGGRIIVRPSWEPDPRQARGGADPDTPEGDARAGAGPDAPGGEARAGAGPDAPGGEARGGADPDAPGGEAEEASGIDVVIDPGQAFGTGAHATTTMCLELLLELADAGEAHGTLADLGTGSGVLAIAAAKLGWAPVIGCDVEVAALEAASENALVNGVQLRLERVNLRELAPPAAATLVANLTSPLIEAVAERLSERPRALVCSGLLAADSDGVRAALAGAGMEVASQRTSGEWVACVARPAGSDGDRG